MRKVILSKEETTKIKVLNKLREDLCILGSGNEYGKGDYYNGKSAMVDEVLELVDNLIRHCELGYDR